MGENQVADLKVGKIPRGGKVLGKTLPPRAKNLSLEGSKGEMKKMNFAT